MNAINEHRTLHLHKLILDAIASSTVKHPVTLKDMNKIVEPIFGGAKVLEQLLEQLSVAKAVACSTGIKDGERYGAYWATDKFSEFSQSIKATSARQFTVAEKGLIKKVHGLMPTQQLLDILNERLVCDLGSDAVPYTMDQLFAEIGGSGGGVPSTGHDWPSLRKLLAKADRDGVLSAIDEQVINDFAVVFSLNQKQVLVLKDIVLQAKEEE